MGAFSRYLSKMKKKVKGQPKQIAERKGVGSEGDLFRETPKTDVEAGSYNPRRRKAYEDLLKRAGE